MSARCPKVNEVQRRNVTPHKIALPLANVSSFRYRKLYVRGRKVPFTCLINAYLHGPSTGTGGAMQALNIRPDQRKLLHVSPHNRDHVIYALDQRLVDRHQPRPHQSRACPQIRSLHPPSRKIGRSPHRRRMPFNRQYSPPMRILHSHWHERLSRFSPERTTCLPHARHAIYWLHVRRNNP